MRSYPQFGVVIVLFSVSCVLKILISAAETQADEKAFNNSVPTIFIFGDSTVDPGNNNYIGTPFRSNFPPYGRDFPNHIPTGRFTNGRLVTDFIVSYIGTKDFLPPYLDPTLSIEDLMTGVSFASAGSGFDPITTQISSVIPIMEQLEYFKEYKGRVEQGIGEEATKSLIERAVYILSAGTNDFVVTYYGTMVRRERYSVSSYVHFMMQLIQQFIQGLWDQGARKIAIIGLPPIGCLPDVITLRSEGSLQQRGCIETLSSVARDYNQILQSKLKSMQNNGRTIIYYVDIFNPIIDIIQRSSQLGFDVADAGCCGTGLIEASFLCNPSSPTCPDASKYVFWDAIHPTERTYYLLFQSILPIVTSIFNQALH